MCSVLDIITEYIPAISITIDLKSGKGIQPIRAVL